MRPHHQQIRLYLIDRAGDYFKGKTFLNVEGPSSIAELFQKGDQLGARPQPLFRNVFILICSMGVLATNIFPLAIAQKA